MVADMSTCPTEGGGMDANRLRQHDDGGDDDDGDDNDDGGDAGTQGRLGWVG